MLMALVRERFNRSYSLFRTYLKLTGVIRGRICGYECRVFNTLGKDGNHLHSAARLVIVGYSMRLFDLTCAPANVILDTNAMRDDLFLSPQFRHVVNKVREQVRQAGPTPFSHTGDVNIEKVDELITSLRRPLDDTIFWNGDVLHLVGNMGSKFIYDKRLMA
jgi:hypothetical protein